MSKKGTGGPAFPQAYQHTNVVAKMYELGELTANQLKQASSQLAGMTLRDYFAANAMQAFIGTYRHEGDVSRNAYKVADAMLEARGESK